MRSLRYCDLILWSISLKERSHFLLATPLVTGLTVEIAPSSHAIIAGYAAAVTIDNFSHRPNETGTVTNTYTQTTANSGSVISEASADTVFISNSHELLAADLSQSKVQGDGNNYSSLGQTSSSSDRRLRD